MFAKPGRHLGVWMRSVIGGPISLPTRTLGQEPSVHRKQSTQANSVSYQSLDVPTYSLLQKIL